MLPIRTRTRKTGNVISTFSFKDNPVQKDNSKPVQGSKSKVQSQSRVSTLVLPSFESDVYSGVSPHAETQERRVLTLWQLTRGAPGFLVLPGRSLITRTVAPARIKNLGAELRVDEDLPPEDLVEKLTASGYVREDPISGVGQFSLRGGIVDVWSPNAENPVRIEFFGDTVDSIRSFDAETQLSTAHLKEISVAPMRELAAVSSDFTDWAFFARERFTGENFARNLKDRTDFAGEGESFSGWEFLFPLVKPLDSTVFDYIEDAVFVIDEPLIVEQNLTAYYDSLQNRFREITESGDIGLEPKELFIEAPELRDRLGQRLELRALGKGAAETGEDLEFENEVLTAETQRRGGEGKKVLPGGPGAAPLFLFPTAEIEAEHEIQSRSTRKFHGNVAEFAAQLISHAGNLTQRRKARRRRERPTPAFGHPSHVTRGALFLIVLQSQGMAERMEEILREYNVPAPPDSLLVGDLSGGFEIPSAGPYRVYGNGHFRRDRKSRVAGRDQKRIENQEQTRRFYLGFSRSEIRRLRRPRRPRHRAFRGPADARQRRYNARVHAADICR